MFIKQLSTNERLQYTLMGVVSIAIDVFTFGTATAAVQGTKAVIKEGLKIIAKDVLTGWGLNLGSQALVNMDLPPQLAFAAHIGLNIAISRSNIKKSKIDVDDVFDINKYVGDKMNKYGMSLEDFHDLKLKPINELTKKEIKIIKDVRDGIPKITSDTLLQKTFTLEEMDNYLSGKYNTIGGFIAKADDIAGIKDYDDMVESLRLDYLADGKRVFPEGADGYAAIRYKSKDITDIKIPYGKELGGKFDIEPPCTLNGFTGSRNKVIVPEWSSSYIKPKKGAELFTMINGKEKVIAIYNGKEFVKI